MKAIRFVRHGAIGQGDPAYLWRDNPLNPGALPLCTIYILTKKKSRRKSSLTFLILLAHYAY